MLSKEELELIVKKGNIDLKMFIGLNTLLIFSMEIFKKNSEIEDFLHSVYGIKFRPYVFRSRTVVVAKISRFIKDFDGKQINKHLKEIGLYFEMENSITTEKKKPKNENANEKLDKWWSKI